MGASIVNQSNDIIPVVIKAGIDSTVKLDNRELVFLAHDRCREVHHLDSASCLAGSLPVGRLGLTTTAFS